jgi:hypothetical protein
MAFGLNVNFSGIVGKLTNNIRSIVSSKISTITNTIKSFSIDTVTSGLTNQIQGMVGTSFNLNLSKLSGGINFANALKDLPFPSLSNININSLYGLIDQNIGVNLNKFAQGLANSYKNINLDEISLGNKLTTAIDDQINSVTDEVEAGIIAGKSSLVVTNQLNNLSNKQIRDFYFKPETQLDYVNGLVEKQKNKIYDLSFNSIPESTTYNNQIINLQEDSIDSFLDTESPLDFSFNDSNIENDITFNTEGIKKQQFQISTIEEGKNPLARKVNLNRYNKEEEMLNYLKTFDDEFKVADNSDPVPSQRYVDYLDPVTGEVIGIEDTVQGVIRPI